MDRVELFQRIEGKRISITTDNMELKTDRVFISLDGELMWDDNRIYFNWDTIGDIREDEPNAFSFYDKGEQVIITISKT